MKIGDVSRSRRFANPARQRWYAHYRSVRFALRMLGPEPLLAAAAKELSHGRKPLSRDYVGALDAFFTNLPAETFGWSGTDDSSVPCFS